MNNTRKSKLELLKQDVTERHGSFVPEMNIFRRDLALWNSAVNYGQSIITTKGGLLLELVKTVTIKIFPHWTLAGEHLIYSSEKHSQNAFFGFKHAVVEEHLEELEAMNFSEEQAVAIPELVKKITQLRGNLVGHPKPESGKEPYEDAYHQKNLEILLARGWMENHSIRDFAKLVKIGFSGLKKEVRNELSGLDIASPEYAEKENFLTAVSLVCDAGILLGKRYAELAREMAGKADNPEEKRRLSMMAETCEKVPGNGAQTFREAVQALWFGHIMTCAEDGINANSIGRLDQILYPYYEKDLASGRITRQEALELMEELACKLYLDYDVQAITLGGVDRNGKCAVNELSYIILEATENFGLIRDLSVRINDDTPEEFIDACSRLIVRGGGIPFIFNDDSFIKALTDRGISPEDATDYAPIGCVELTIPGKANPHAVSGWFNSTKCLELALFNGVDHRSGCQFGPKTGELSTFKSFDELYKAYCAQVKFFADRMVYRCNAGELKQRDFGPMPCWSLLTDDCIKRGKDITNGGPLYNYHSICFLGAPDTADSLFAMKKCLFEEKNVDPETLLEALRNDFSGFEILQKQLRKLPKYGNDISEVDLLTKQVCDDFISLMDTMRSPLDGRYFVHLFTFILNLSFGRAVGAMPDGRNAETPLAYSLSAHQGRDEKGLTAMLNSLAKQPHDKAAGGSAAIIDINPSLLQGSGKEKLMSNIIRTGLKMGIGQMQWNITTVEQLEKARKDPDRYGNTPVRVAGYSQMFKLITPELQDHIIARTKHQS